jgi:acetyl-CoA carboxylase biotin carboxyl carrier protein
MTNEEISDLIRLAQESQVAELEVQRGENRVRIRLAVAMPEGAPVAAASVPTVVAPAVAAASAPAAAPEENLQMVTSPIVGTFYEAPKPGDPVFAKVGDSISKGQVLCIIESMKLMNEIESDFAGTVVKRFVENGQPVEYGQTLFAVKPN